MVCKQKKPLGRSSTTTSPDGHGSSAEFVSFARGSNITPPQQKLGIHQNTRTVGSASDFQTQQKRYLITGHSVHDLAWLKSRRQWVTRAEWLMRQVFMLGGEREVAYATQVSYGR